MICAAVTLRTEARTGIQRPVDPSDSRQTHAHR